VPEFGRGQDMGLALGDAASVAAPLCENCRKDFVAGALLAFRDMLLQGFTEEEQGIILGFVNTAPVPDFGEAAPTPPPAA